mgnify:CR=1 FL=1
MPYSAVAHATYPWVSTGKFKLFTLTLIATGANVIATGFTTVLFAQFMPAVAAGAAASPPNFSATGGELTMTVEAGWNTKSATVQVWGF